VDTASNGDRKLGVLDGSPALERPHQIPHRTLGRRQLLANIQDGLSSRTDLERRRYDASGFSRKIDLQDRAVSCAASANHSVCVSRAFKMLQFMRHTDVERAKTRSLKGLRNPVAKYSCYGTFFAVIIFGLEQLGISYISIRRYVHEGTARYIRSTRFGRQHSE
jgi:hypothetical protein